MNTDQSTSSPERLEKVIDTLVQIIREMEQRGHIEAAQAAFKTLKHYHRLRSPETVIDMERERGLRA